MEQKDYKIKRAEIFKSANDGILSGYANVYNIEDLQGDVSRAGSNDLELSLQSFTLCKLTVKSQSDAAAFINFKCRFWSKNRFSRTFHSAF